MGSAGRKAAASLIVACVGVEPYFLYFVSLSPVSPSVSVEGASASISCEIMGFLFFWRCFSTAESAWLRAIGTILPSTWAVIYLQVRVG